MTNKEKANQHGLPESFRPLMWSYEFADIDPATHKLELIVNTINYGDLPHWRWIIRQYGRVEVKHVLTSVPITTIRSHVLRLVSLIFGISQPEYNHAPRGSH